MSYCKDRRPGYTSFRSFHWFYLLVATFIFIAALGYYATRMVLVILPEQGKETYAFPTYIGDRWNISLTHSVQKTPWEEFFRVDGVNKMTLTHTTFQSLGWGYPYAEYEGKLTLRLDNRYELSMNRSMASVPLRISVQAMQHFHHGATDLDLCKIYGQGTRMDIKVMKRYEYWNYKFNDL